MDSLATVFSTITVFTIGIFALYVFASWFSGRETLRPYRNIGFAMGGILLLLEFITLIGLSIQNLSPSLGLIILTDTIAFFRIAAFTIVGISLCKRLNLHSLPWVMEHFIYTPPTSAAPNLMESASGAGRSEFVAEASLGDATTLHASEAEATAAIDTEAEPTSFEELDVQMAEREPFLPNRMIAISIGVAILAILYSVGLFLLTKPSLSELLTSQLGEETIAPSFASIMIAITFAFIEEITFRLGIQNIVAYQFNWVNEKYWFAILFSSTLWTMAHIGVLEPNWVKMAQIFPVGLVLGWLFKRFGVESSIIVHLVFNLVLVLIGDQLISIT